MDVYSFGMVLWELTTRRTPYADVGAYGTRQAIASGNIPPMPPAAPPALRELYHACCALQPEARPIMDQAVSALEKLMAEGPDDVKTTARGAPAGTPATATPLRLLTGTASHVSTGRSSTGSPAVLSLGGRSNTSPVPALKLKTRHSKVPPPVVSMPVDDDDSDESSTPSSMKSAASAPLHEEGGASMPVAATSMGKVDARVAARPVTPPLPPAPAVLGDAQAALAAIKQLGCKHVDARVRGFSQPKTHASCCVATICCIIYTKLYICTHMYACVFHFPTMSLVQVAAATQVATFAQHGQPQRNQVIKAGAVPRLIRMLCAAEPACQKAALATLLVLLDGPEGPSDQVGPPKRRGFRALLLKVRCCSLH